MEVLSTTAYQPPRRLEPSHFNPSHLIIESEQTTNAELLPNAELLLVERQADGERVQTADPTIVSGRSSDIAEEADQHLWKVFGSTFITIFLAELGDKTQVATLLMTAESHAPWIVFTGAAAALITTSLLGVLLGHWLSSRVSPKTLDTIAGITLAILSIWLLWDVFGI